MRNKAFLDLKEKEEVFGMPPERVHKGIKQNLSTFKMIGNVVEMFIPSIIQMFISISGGNVNKVNQNEKTKRSNAKYNDPANNPN
ncbi:MAG: hypothetical protein KA010_02105 [Saprospiraceae bacterium]|nr:hypothetical protein [Saprospiraceae bacterium]